MSKSTCCSGQPSPVWFYHTIPTAVEEERCVSCRGWISDLSVISPRTAQKYCPETVKPLRNALNHNKEPVTTQYLTEVFVTCSWISRVKKEIEWNRTDVEITQMLLRWLNFIADQLQPLMQSDQKYHSGTAQEIQQRAWGFDLDRKILQIPNQLSNHGRDWHTHTSTLQCHSQYLQRVCPKYLNPVYQKQWFKYEKSVHLTCRINMGDVETWLSVLKRAGDL